MSRCSRGTRVFFVEPALFHAGAAQLEVTRTPEGVYIAAPTLPEGLTPAEVNGHLTRMIEALQLLHRVPRPTLWYSSPHALPFTRHVMAELVVYDISHEVGPELLELERELLGRADVVFTGGEALSLSKHPDAQSFPSSVDVTHFARARCAKAEPTDQRDIPRPRLGFVGPIDARLDLQLVAQLAAAKPDWHFVMLGRAEGADLPLAPNLHWLGEKSYDELPDYLAGWNAALLPLLIDDAIGPVSAPELLAAGRPVIATPVVDVMRPYGELHLVKVAFDADGFMAAVESIASEDPLARQRRADAFLSAISWDMTWHRMSNALEEARSRQHTRRAA